MGKEKLLISACLLGTPCRYDGKSIPFSGLSELLEYFELIPICPEVDGGLPIPRIPSERVGERVINKSGDDVSENYLSGAKTALRKAQENGIRLALLKERSPSCGKGVIYDGSFTGVLTYGNGVTAEMLMNAGITVFGESEIKKLVKKA